MTQTTQPVPTTQDFDREFRSQVGQMSCVI